MIESASAPGHNMANGHFHPSGSCPLLHTPSLCRSDSCTVAIGLRSDYARATSGTVASVASMVGAPLNLSVQDWDTLFRAVEERLQRIVGEPNAGAAHLPKHNMCGAAREAVEECVGALDQLHTALTHERARVNARGKLVDVHTME